MPPILLSELQFLAIANAAAALCPPDRDLFYAAVAAELRGRPIGDGSVGCAIRTAQAKFHHPEPERMPSRGSATRRDLRKHRGGLTRARGDAVVLGSRAAPTDARAFGVTLSGARSRSASASSKAFNVSSTVPRTTRSRWLLIRSSSIVMTLFSGLRCIV